MKKYLIGMLFILLLVGGCAGCNDTRVSTEHTTRTGAGDAVETSGNRNGGYIFIPPESQSRGRGSGNHQRYFDLTADKLKDYAGELNHGKPGHCTASLTATYEVPISLMR